MTEHQRNLSRRGSAALVVAIVLVIVLVAGGAIWMFYARRGGQEATRTLTPEGKAYVRNLPLSDVDMKATESFLEQQLVEITGKITNSGDRAVRFVEVECIFYDPYQNVIFRQRVPIVRAQYGPLKPGDTRPFRLPFDEIPPNWNQGLPQMVISQLEFAE
jgi:Protein of unknown function (DUF3426).